MFGTHSKIAGYVSRCLFDNGECHAVLIVIVLSTVRQRTIIHCRIHTLVAPIGIDFSGKWANKQPNEIEWKNKEWRSLFRPPIRYTFHFYSLFSAKSSTSSSFSTKSPNNRKTESVAHSTNRSPISHTWKMNLKFFSHSLSLSRFENTKLFYWRINVCMCV